MVTNVLSAHHLQEVKGMQERLEEKERAIAEYKVEVLSLRNDVKAINEMAPSLRRIIERAQLFDRELRGREEQLE